MNTVSEFVDNGVYDSIYDSVVNYLDGVMWEWAHHVNPGYAWWDCVGDYVRTNVENSVGIEVKISVRDFTSDKLNEYERSIKYFRIL
jgi:hypothetical protein